MGHLVEGVTHRRGVVGLQFLIQLLRIVRAHPLTLLAKQLYRLSTVKQYIVKIAIRYYVFSSCKCM